jgi:hypothetical protein
MILLQHSGPHADETQAKLVEQLGLEDARPFQSRVLAVIQGEAAVAWQRAERIDRIEGTEDVVIDQRIMG